LTALELKSGDSTGSQPMRQIIHDFGWTKDVINIQSGGLTHT